MSVSIRKLDTTTSDFEEGTLTDVVVVDDGLELDNNPALEFDGDAYIEADITQEHDYITVEFWVDLEGMSVDDDREILVYAGGASTEEGWHWRIQEHEDELVIWHELQDDSKNRWSNYDNIENYVDGLHHFSFSWEIDNYKYKFYIDGSLISEYDTSDSGDTDNDTLTNPIGKFSNPATIGGAKYGWSNDEKGLTGYMDEFRLWEIERTQTEIQDNMNKELNGDESGLIAYYKMNEGSGDTASDSAGDNDGDIEGATWVNNYISWNLDGTGIRTSEPLDLTPVGELESSLIEWDEILNGETITIETSVDDGDSWQTCTNGEPIPDLPDDLDGVELLVRATLETEDTTETPVLEELEVFVETAVENDDTGNIAGTETQRFILSFDDNGVFNSTEDNSPLMIEPQDDSGYFNADAENYYTILFEVTDEGSLTSTLDDYNQEGWIRNPRNTSNWKKIDENKENLWTKVEKNTADWKKVGGE